MVTGINEPANKDNDGDGDSDGDSDVDGDGDGNDDDDGDDESTYLLFGPPVYVLCRSISLQQCNSSITIV
jgi:hypothetical protein